MSKSPIIIKNLAFVGPGRGPALIDFDYGLNVVCGASDTGKSFLIEVIDFMLGGTADLRDIPERIGYDRARLSVETKEQDLYTFEKSTEGGNFSLYKGVLKGELKVEAGEKINAKHTHGKKDNISGWILDKINLFEKRIRKNQQGITKSLSFRDIARLIVVTESEIIKQSSPFLSGQVVNRTAEYSALKLLLTGVDDSAIVPVDEVGSRDVGIAAKIELIDQWVTDLRDEIESRNLKEDELLEQNEKLEESIQKKKENMSAFQEVLDESITARREIIGNREKIKDRLGEIEELLERFELLGHHYRIDIERLKGIEESGSLFVHQEKVPCPLCGAMTDEQHLDQECEGNVESIVLAAVAEIEKINRLSLDLTQTISELGIEKVQLNDEIGLLNEKYKIIDQEIREAISPDFRRSQMEYVEYVDKKNEVINALNIFERIEKLEYQKADLAEAEGVEAKQEAVDTKLSKAVLHDFSKNIERILKEWNFPGTADVYFDESAKDFVIAGKPRGSRGKGLRAITHAAVTIGLMEYCQKNSLPHPGFVVLDSPLLAYYKPEGDEDDLQGTDLKERFYNYLVKNHAESQIIIVENEHPPEQVVNQINLTDFTKNPHKGRYGLFPMKN